MEVGFAVHCHLPPLGATSRHGDQQYMNFLFNEVGDGPTGKKRPPMKTVRFLFFRPLLLITFITTYLYFLYGQEREQGVPIARNAAWNDLVRQIDPSMDDSPRETLGKEIVLIQKFLKEHQSEASVGIYDINVFKAIDQARARLQKADKDLEAIKNALSYRESQATAGR